MIYLVKYMSLDGVCMHSARVSAGDPLAAKRVFMDSRLMMVLGSHFSSGYFVVRKSRDQVSPFDYPCMDVVPLSPPIQLDAFPCATDL